MTARTFDGAELHEAGIDWTWHEDVDDEGQRHGWWQCGRCDGTATGDNSRAAHQCQTDCCQCGKRLRWVRVAPRPDAPVAWVTDEGDDSTAFCAESDDNRHVPECDQ